MHGSVDSPDLLFFERAAGERQVFPNKQGKTKTVTNSNIRFDDETKTSLLNPNLLSAPLSVKSHTHFSSLMQARQP